MGCAHRYCPSMCAGSCELEGHSAPCGSYRQAMSCVTVLSIHACVTIRCIIPRRRGRGRKEKERDRTPYNIFQIRSPLSFVHLCSFSRLPDVCLPALTLTSPWIRLSYIISHCPFHSIIPLCPKLHPFSARQSQHSPLHYQAEVLPGRL
jgi:hypothetical protein